MGRHITKMFGEEGKCASRLLMRGKKQKKKVPKITKKLEKHKGIRILGLWMVNESELWVSRTGRNGERSREL